MVLFGVGATCLVPAQTHPRTDQSVMFDVLSKIEYYRNTGKGNDTAYIRLLLKAAADINFRHKASMLLAEARSMLSPDMALDIHADFLFAAGMLARFEERYHHASDTLHKALDCYIVLGDKYKVALAYSRLGLLYHQLGQYEQAIEHHMHALDIAKEIDSHDMIFRQNVNLAHILNMLNKPKRALRLLQEAEVLMPKETIPQRRSALYQYKAEAYMRLERLDSALVMIAIALSYAQQAVYRDTLAIASLLGNLAQIYQRLGQSARAQALLDSALMLDGLLKHSLNNIRLGVEAARIMLIRANQESNQHRKVLYYRSALRYAERTLRRPTVVLPYKLIVYQILAEVHTALGNYTSGIEMYRSYITLRDSIFNTGLESLIDAAEERLQRSRREYEIEKLRIAHAAQMRLQYVLLAVVVLLVLLLILLWNRFYLKKRSEAIIAAMNQELRVRNAQLAESAMLLNEAHTRLSVATQHANEVTAMKRVFLDMLSHEIRTPLTAIQGYSDILMWELECDRHRSMLERIKTAGEQLLMLLEDVRCIATMRGEQIETHVRPVSVQALCEQVYAMVSNLAYTKGLQLKYEIHTKIIRHVMLDEPKIRLILVSLLDNAIRFTERGYVKLSVFFNEESDTLPHCIEFCVEDTGSGISLEKLEHVMHLPHAVSIEQSANAIRTQGLGLAICQRFVHAMNGTMKIRSEEGKGTVVNIIVPVLDVLAELETVNGSIKREAKKQATMSRC
ncbi:MAG: tetratricopeptide repeat protein [Bacteroidota bacterium]|nr:tetratricopeptide repeat protein [Candidatus Kapabacteria bacterium]MDW8220913.1 tetratricopeptide repeat protein [Bacteroidota bacterium]